MSKTIDERVVEMRFDNKQFEQNAKSTLGTLSKLKQALSFTDSTKALGELEKSTKNISLDGIASGIETLERRFSTLGIVGMRVIENMTDGMMNGLGKAVHFVTDSIVSGGLKRASNIENAHFQLQALLKDETKVQAVMADAMDAVDGTAYAYDEAAKAASQFSASGVQAGEEMQGALRGITGVAAMTNSSFEDVSMIFTTVAGNGRLMGDQLLQLSSRGLNAASTLSDYFREVKGQAGITEGAIRDMVSKGQISFKDFSNAMTWAFGDSAKRANETFTGSLSNMKSALARIGAGFFSPFVEQNGEMVKLFNALRIQINNVKSALVFDEQTSALSGLTKQADLMVDTVSKFAKDGTTSFESFTNAILGTSKSADELSAANETLSKLFAEVKENGSASVETLIAFKDTGINASDAIRKYMNGVLDGTIKVSDAVKQSVKDITGGTKLIGGDVVKLAEDGKISFDILADSIVNASGTIQKGSEVTNTAIKNLFSKVKEEGKVTTEALIEFNQNGMDAAQALRKYMDGVADGSIRASYATKSAIDEITQGTKLAGGDIIKLAEEGKITYDIFQSAMENMYGDQKALSKQFTDFVLDNLSELVNAIQNTDLTKPMEAFYFGVEAVKNSLKGLWSVIKPVGQAFADVFLNFSGDDMVDFAASIEKVTAKMKLSERGSKNLHDAFEGVFNVIKLLVDGFLKLIGVSTDVISPVGSLTELFLELLGLVGRGLTKFTQLIRQCPLISAAFNGVGKAFHYAMEGLSFLIDTVRKFGDAIYDLPIVQRILDSISKSFADIGSNSSPLIEKASKSLEEFRKYLEDIVPKEVEIKIEKFTKTISELLETLMNADLSDVTGWFGKLSDAVDEFFGIFMKNDGINTFVTNFQKFIDTMGENFTIDNALEKIRNIKDTMDDFISWVKETLGPFFSGASFGGAIAAGSGIGAIYAMLQIAKPLKELVGSIKTVPKAFDAMKGALEAYQSDLKADALLKTAGAIAVLSGSLILLSFADTDKILEASVALSLIAGVLLAGIDKFLEVKNKARTIEDVAFTLSKGLSKMFKNFGKAKKWEAIGKAVKSMGEALIMVAGTIIAVGLVYNKNPQIIKDGAKITGIIAAAVMGMITIMSALGNKLEAGMNAFSKAAFGVLAISMAMNMIIKAMNNLFKMELPSDYQEKLVILAGILMGVAGLIGVVSIATRIAGQHKLKSGPLVAVAVLLYTTVSALGKLFEMDLPSDYPERFGILLGIFGGLSALIVAVGIASRIAKGNMKATGTLLAMCAVIGTITLSLMLLSIIPGDKLLNGAIALGAVLTTLALALVGAGKVASKDSWRTVAAMAAVVISVTASLGILSMIPADKLLKAAVALGGILLAVALDFNSVGKVSDENAWTTVLSMIAAMMSVAIALALLSERPWKNMLGAGAAMSATLLAFSKAYETILKPNWSKNSVKKIGTFLLLTTSVVPIGGALAILANQPWEGLVSSAIAFSTTIIAFSKAYQMILKPNWSQNAVKKIGTFLLLTTSVLPIGAALAILANQPWEGMLASAVALSSTLLAFTACFAIISKCNPDMDSILLFGAATVAVLGVSASLAILANQPLDAIIPAAHALSETLLAMTAAMAVCALVGNFASAAIQGIGLLDLFVGNLLLVMVGLGALFENISALSGFLDTGIEILVKLGEGLGRFAGAIIGGVFMEISNSLPVIGQNLSDFWSNASVFFNGISSIGEGTLQSVVRLSSALMTFTGAELLQGLSSLLGFSLKDVGVELSEFWAAGSAFFNGIAGVEPSSVEASKMVADMCLTFTKSELISGISRLLGFKGGMSDFGEELKAFGPSIASFANTVKGVTAASVEGAASAAKILAETAKALPAQNGWVNKVFGSKSLKDFGVELLAFGPSIKAFSIIVKDVKPEAVEGAASAGQIMAKLATELPAQGGLASKIFGTRSISEFGAELVSFGPKIKEFANTVAGISPTAVIGVSTITSIMSKLANELPNQGGLVSWFTGDNTLATFGANLVQFGQYFQTFYGYIQGISTGPINNLVASFHDLIQLVKDVEGVNSYAVSEFVNGLSGVATGGIEAFCVAFTSSTPQVTKAVQTMMTFALTAIQIKAPQFLMRGMESAKSWIDGWKTKYGEAMNAGITLASNVLKGLKLQLVNFYLVGSNSAGKYLSGIKDKYGEANSVGVSLSSNALTGVKANQGSFYSAGVNAGQGFVNGVRSMKGEAAAAGSALGEAAYEAAKRALKEKSPSRKMREVGDYAGMGFVMQLLRWVDKASDAGEMLGESSLNAVTSVVDYVTDLIDQDFEIQPMIYPLVDVSSVRQSTDEITRMFNDAISKTSFDVEMASLSMKARNNRGKIEATKPFDQNGLRGDSYIFNQYNTSPKALSRSEIYRDTSNQFAMFRKAVKKK